MKDVFDFKHYMRELFYPIRLMRYKIKWRKKNGHNRTELNCIIPLDKIVVGKGTYGMLNVLVYNWSLPSKLRIGNYCSISNSAVFMLGGGHDYHKIFTYPFRKMNMGTDESISKGDIVLEDDVWLGENVTIMSGVTVGHGAVIGTNSLVTKDIPPYAVAYGIPAKVVKYRFSEEIIKRVSKIDMEKLNDNLIVEHIDELYEDVTNETDLSWLPMKK